MGLMLVSILILLERDRLSGRGEERGDVRGGSQLTAMYQVSCNRLHGTCLCFQLGGPNTRGGQAAFPSIVAGQSNQVRRSVTMADKSGIPLDVVTSSRLFLSREVDWGCAGKSCESCLVFASINALCEGTRETRETPRHWHVRVSYGISCFRTCYMHA